LTVRYSGITSAAADQASRVESLFHDGALSRMLPRSNLKETIMSIQLGSIAPDFEQDSTEGKIRFHEWAGKSWVILFSHPKDFTPVCTTELGVVAKLKPEFEKRNVKVIALSVDDVDSHKRWTGDIEETQKTKLNYPIIGDPDRKVSNLYDMIHPQANDTLTVRSVFIIDPNKKVRLTLTYPASTGRNFDEILRVVDSLQLTDSHSVATPANWKDGQDVIIVPSLQDPEQLKQKFPKGFTVVKPYLRVTPQPNR
jgi:alkyl hydroperoxide reductase subunit AhpC